MMPVHSDTPYSKSAETYNAAVALHHDGRLIEAEAAYRAVLVQTPDHVGALQGLGVLHLQSGKTDAAIDCLSRSVGLHATATGYNNLGVALSSAGRYEEAVEAYRQSVALAPTSAPTLTNLGYALLVLDRPDEALPALQAALAQTPDAAKLHHHTARALIALGQSEEAVAHLKRAATAARNEMILCDLGQLLNELGRPAEAASQFHQALSLAPRSARALNGLGEAMGRMGRHAEALEQFDRAITEASDYAVAHYNRGAALAYLGRKPEATTALGRACALAPDNTSFANALVALNGADDKQLSDLESRQKSEKKLPTADRIELHFTLGKVYDETGRYEEAFAQWQAGNMLRHAAVPYDVDADIRRMHAIAHTFSAAFLQQRAGCGVTDEMPVFIVGMPRSGTSLVEQILASHPAVFGAGECNDLPLLLASGGAGPRFPDHATKLPPEAWRSLATSYLSALRAHAPQSQLLTLRRITDKMPLNFAHIGVIRILFPAARILHVRRHPLDTCLSCYSLLFEQGLDFTYDLAELGRYYRAYHALMQHWLNALPQDVILPVQYETLVSHPDSEIRRITDWCGLDWDERCLRFYETPRAVMTASAQAVRSPVHTGSVGRWRAYERQMKPLTDILSDILPDDVI